jgi:hypothetical protein
LRVAVFFTAKPELWMMAGPFSSFTSTTVCTYMRSCWSMRLRSARFASRVAAAPLVRVSVAVSEFCRSVMAALTAASAGEGLGK